MKIELDDDDTPMIVTPEDIKPRWIAEEGRLNTIELELRYRWAKDVKYLHERPQLFGIDAARYLSDVFSRNDHDIHDYYCIATYVSQDFVDTVLAYNRQRNGQRGYITWQHLRCFACVLNLNMRRQLLELCMTNQWSVYELRQEVNKLEERLRNIADKVARTPSLKTLVARVSLSTSQLCEDAFALDGDDVRMPPDKLRTASKKAVAELDAASQSIATCIERLQAALGSLERAKAIATTKPDGRRLPKDTGATK